MVTSKKSGGSVLTVSGGVEVLGLYFGHKVDFQLCVYLPKWNAFQWGSYIQPNLVDLGLQVYIVTW